MGAVGDPDAAQRGPLSPHARVLLVEDDALQAEAIAFAIRQDGYAVEIASSGAQGLARALATPAPDVVVLDLGLPDVGGVHVARRLRQSSDVPLLMLTARAQVVDKIVGFEAGADDYLTKPFDTSELLVRLRSLLRRRAAPRPAPIPTNVIQIGALQLDSAKRRLTVDDRVVPLSAREFDILWLLAEARGATVPRRQVFNAIWGSSFVGDERALDVYIKTIRRKIEPDRTRHRYLHTVRRFGYRLADEPPEGAG
ncbi:MAG TPA: response regulator transcription factor [Chloroflexota bacterium]|nr:response regulator transcription factor [Chloroflexota bacterium]